MSSIDPKAHIDFFPRLIHDNVGVRVGQVRWNASVMGGVLRLDASSPELFPLLSQASGWKDGYGSLTAYLFEGLDFMGEYDPLASVLMADVIAGQIRSLPRIIVNFKVETFGWPRDKMENQFEGILRSLTDEANGTVNKLLSS